MNRGIIYLFVAVVINDSDELIEKVEISYCDEVLVFEKLRLGRLHLSSYRR